MVLWENVQHFPLKSQNDIFVAIFQHKIQKKRQSTTWIVNQREKIDNQQRGSTINQI